MDEIIQKIKSETDIFSKARLIRHLLREKEMKVIDLAKTLSMTSSYICHLNRLNNLPEAIVDGYYSHLINISHLFLLSRIKDEKKLMAVYEKVLSDNMTIKQTEELISELVYEVKLNGVYMKLDEKNKLKENIKKKHPEIDVSIIQTRSRAKVNLLIKGSLEETSKKIKKIINELTEEDHS